MVRVPGALALLAICFVAERAAADVHLDFGATGQRVQTGYQAVSGTGTGTIGATSFTVPSAALPGGETVSIASDIELSFRDRGNYTAANHGGAELLLEDYIRAGTGATTGTYPTMTIDIGGLKNDSEYEVVLRMYDGGNGSPGTYTFTITGTNDANLLNNTYSVGFDQGGTGSTTAAERAGHIERFFSSATGTLQLTLVQLTGGERIIPINSLDVVAVPEPASAGLVAAACIALLRRRRRGAHADDQASVNVKTNEAKKVR